MDALAAISRLETPTLVINHCSDVGCSHPSCWASRKLYRRNAYLLMLKGVPPSEIRVQEPSAERQTAVQRAAEIPTQKVHNLVYELFNSSGGQFNDSDDWQSVGAGGRGISAGQLSIKHMPTPMSSLSRQQRLPKSKSQGHEAGEDGENGDDDGSDEEEAEDENGTDEDLSRRRRLQPYGRRPVPKQRTLRVQDLSQQQQQQQEQQELVGRQHAALHHHSREYVWVPNPNRKPKEGPLRRSEPDPSLGRFNINEELGQFLQEDNYNQRQAALQERAVERSHLSTARVQRFYKSMPVATTARQHVDLFKLPSDLLSEVLRGVDQGQPMTNESLVRMVEHATETPTGQTVQPNAQTQPQASGSEFERHVLRQRRAQLHNSESGRNLREPQKHTAKAPVFLMDTSSLGAEIEKRRLPPIEGAASGSKDKLQKKTKPKGTAGGSSKLVVGQFKRSLGRDCQLMLGPVSASSTPNPDSAPISARSQNSSAAGGSDTSSMAVQCQSGRSTLLDEVLPSRKPGEKDSTLAILMSMNRPNYDLDDPWNDAVAVEAPHPTTRDGTRLTVATGSNNEDDDVNSMHNAEDQQRRTTMNSAADAYRSLTTPIPDGAELLDEPAEVDKVEDNQPDSERLTAPFSAIGGTGAPPPSPDDFQLGRSVASPPPAPAHRQQGAAAAGRAASSGRLMPAVDEDDEVNG